MNLRIRVLLAIGLSSYGLTFAQLSRFRENYSVRLSPQNNYGREFEQHHSLPFRGFGHFSNNQKGNATMARLLTQMAKLNADVAQLMQIQRHQKTHMNALEARNGRSFSNREGLCPPVQARNGGKVIGDYCYIVGKMMLPFAEAQEVCYSLHGYFAQPVPKVSFNLKLYSDLKSIFPTEFEYVENVARHNPKRLWIGYMQEDGDADGGVFTGQESGPTGLITVDSGDVIFDEVAETAAQEGVAITDTGFWTIFPITTKLPFICQFPLI